MTVELSTVCKLIKGSMDPQRYAGTTFAHYSIPAFDSGTGPAIERGAAIHSQKTPIPCGVVLVSKLNPRIPRVWHVSDDQQYQRICSTEFVPLQPDSSALEPEYLSFALREALQAGFIKGNTAAATKSRERAKPADFLRLQIRVPALANQRRVVDLLSRAENIVRMRREAEEKAMEIIPALFLDMFGDPARNPRGWRVRRLGDVVERFEGGKNLLAGSAGDSEFRILKISAVTSGQYNESEAKPAPNGFYPPAHYIVRSGDVLFSRANTENLVGATAIVESTDGKSLLPDKLWRLVWKPDEEVRPVYMLALLQNRSIRRALSKIASGTGGSMKNISQAKLSELRLPIAPPGLQRAFEIRVAAVSELLIGSEQGGRLADQIFQSLLAGVFGDGTRFQRS